MLILNLILVIIRLKIMLPPSALLALITVLISSHSKFIIYVTSDHTPLIVSLWHNKIQEEPVGNAENDPKEHKPNLNWKNSEQKQLYVEHLALHIDQNGLIDKLNGVNQQNGTSTITQVVESLHHYMDLSKKQAIETYLKPRHRVLHKKNKKWWNDELEFIHKNVVEAYQQVKMSGGYDQQAKDKHRSLKRLFRKTQRRCMNEIEDKDSIKINKIFTRNRLSFWKQVRKKKNKRPKQVKIDTEVLANNFKQLFNEKLISNEENMNKLSQIVMNYEIGINNNYDKYEISEFTIERILKELENNKTNGASGTTNEQFKHGLCWQLIILLKNMFEKMIQFNIIPQNFNIGKISPIIKDDNGSEMDLNNVRPITISDTISNIYEKVMLNEINKTHKDATKQFGFKRNSSCQHAIFTVRETIVHHREAGKPVFACAIDASKAFDKVNRVALFQKLISRTHPQIWRILKTYYNDSIAFVDSNGKTSNAFKTTIGVKQGGPLSPKLFSIYIEDLIAELEKENLILKIDNINTGVVLFADDIIILCKSKEDLNKALRICDDYGVKYEIKYNPDKTKYMIFGSKKQQQEESNIVLSGKKLEKVSCIRYLGVMINSYLSNVDHLKERKHKLLKATYLLNRIGIRNPKLRPYLKGFLYKTYCRQIMYYGLENYPLTKKELSNTQTTEGIIIKRFLNLNKKSRTTKLLHALYIEPTAHTILKQKLLFIKRLMNNDFTKNLIIYYVINMLQNHLYHVINQFWLI
jgi:hypothetical protein